METQGEKIGVEGGSGLGLAFRNYSVLITDLQTGMEYPEQASISNLSVMDEQFGMRMTINCRPVGTPWSLAECGILVFHTTLP